MKLKLKFVIPSLFIYMAVWLFLFPPYQSPDEFSHVVTAEKVSSEPAIPFLREACPNCFSHSFAEKIGFMETIHNPGKKLICPPPEFKTFEDQMKINPNHLGNETMLIPTYPLPFYLLSGNVAAGIFSIEKPGAFQYALRLICTLLSLLIFYFWVRILKPLFPKQNVFFCLIALLWPTTIHAMTTYNFSVWDGFVCSFYLFALFQIKPEVKTKAVILFILAGILLSTAKQNYLALAIFAPFVFNFKNLKHTIFWGLAIATPFLIFPVFNFFNLTGSGSTFIAKYLGHGVLATILICLILFIIKLKNYNRWFFWIIIFTIVSFIILHFIFLFSHPHQSQDFFIFSTYNSWGLLGWHETAIPKNYTWAMKRLFHIFTFFGLIRMVLLLKNNMDLQNRVWMGMSLYISVFLAQAFFLYKMDIVVGLQPRYFLGIWALMLIPTFLGVQWATEFLTRLPQIKPAYVMSLVVMTFCIIPHFGAFLAIISRYYPPPSWTNLIQCIGFVAAH